MNGIFDDDIPVYLASPFNYTGSKFNLLDQLFSKFPDLSKVDYFYDLFCGGGSVFVNVNTPAKIIANDIFAPIIDFYKEIQKEEWDTIWRNISKSADKCANKEDYYALTKEYNLSKNIYDFFALNSSCLNNYMRINKKMNWNASYGQRTVTSNIYQKLLEYWKKLHGSNEKYEFVSMNFDAIEIKSNSFVYLDPPYIITDVGYTNIWNEGLDERMYDFMKFLDKLSIPFAMSNVTKNKGVVYERLLKEVRDCRYNLVNMNYDYSHVGVNGINKPKKNETQEVLITNYK